MSDRSETTAYPLEKIEATERDAARYRWLKEQYRAFDEGQYNSPTPSGLVVDANRFDAIVDEEIARAWR